MMSLSEWMRREAVTVRALARTVGVSASTVSRIARGRITPSLPLALRLVEATGGAVAIESLLSVSPLASAPDGGRHG